MKRLSIAAALFAMFAVAGLTGCGDNAGDGVQSDNKADAGNTGSGDIADEKDTGPTQTDTTTADAGASDPDTGATDAAVTPACPGGPGCECGGDNECYSGHCLDVGGAKVCAGTCADGCKDDEVCITTGGDQICVPKFGAMCNPCKANKECEGPENSGNKCVQRGADGSFCGSKCATSTDCPKGYLCEDGKDVEGKAVRQCVLPVDEICSCSDGANKGELSTVCLAKHDNGGFCAGERRCLAKGAPGAPADGGLTPCVAPEPATETCDGVDDDCDGTTDEDTCDDFNVCTTDSCAPSGCVHLPDSGKACDADGDVCTLDDVCSDGTCTAGKAKECDDGNPCTLDVCDPKSGCTSTPDDGQGCNADDNNCTVADVCKDGACVAGGAKACESGDDCVKGKCDLDSGKCKYTTNADVPCNDGNPCTESETCAGEICKGTLVVCDDKSACTSDSCHPVTGCKHQATAGPCDDADKCTTKDECADGKCVGLALAVTAECDDDNACTIDSCKAATGCFHKKLDGTTCSDGNACTTGDLCKVGVCSAGPNSCGCANDKDCESKEDGNKCNGTLVCDPKSKTCETDPASVVKCDTSINSSCQLNACDAKSGACNIAKSVDGKPCDADGSVCTKDDACSNGKCQIGKSALCNDGNDCTADACDEKSGCSYKPNVDPCDADGSKCTQADRCENGTCVAGKLKGCDDNEACTKDVCRASDAVCLYQPVTDTCDDSNKCTLNEQCGKNPTTLAWTCVATQVLACNDGNPCTNDKCDSVKGCVTEDVPDGGGCDDGNKCTNGDTCKSGSCAGSAVVAKDFCDDFNVCTDDVCSPDKGCLNNPTGSKVCSDDDKCTQGDACKDGKCLAGTNTCGCSSTADCKSKEDGNACNGTLYCEAASSTCKINPATVVSCDTSLNNACQSNGCDPIAGKCAVTKKKDTTPCNADDNVCTGQDACADGACVPGTLLKCNDDNPCTSDSCDPKAGCVNTAISGSCDDGDKCTALDTCQGGGCKGKPIDVKTDCADGNSCTVDGCDAKLGCTNKALADNATCDDANVCTVSDTCKSGKCDGGTNVCACKTDGDCKDKEDGNACNGTLFCDTKGVSECKVNPTTVVVCNTSDDNFCKKTACNASTGKCEADVKQDKSPCDADSSVCTTADACASGKCSVGPALPCDDQSPCTVDSCDPKQGCVHTAKAGPCDADGDACTVGDSCAAGKCVIGKKKDCADGTSCTTDSCDKSSGNCSYVKIVSSCDDGTVCTVGDKCGTDGSGKYTCVAGPVADCDDNNPCTIDACDLAKGCSNTVSTLLTAPCFTGDPKNRGVGECSDGKQRCEADGTLGKCNGSVEPASEICDSKDNSCNGVTDEGCAPTDFIARLGNGVVEGKGTKYGARAFAGGGPVCGVVKAPVNSKFGANFGFYEWLAKKLK